MAPKFKDGDAVVAFSGKWVSWAHTAVAYAAFLGALFTGLYLHYYKIVENQYYVRSPRPNSPCKLLIDSVRAILKNGFPPYPPRLVIGIRSDPFSRFSSPSHLAHASLLCFYGTS